MIVAGLGTVLAIFSRRIGASAWAVTDLIARVVAWWDGAPLRWPVGPRGRPLRCLVLPAGGYPLIGPGADGPSSSTRSSRPSRRAPSRWVGSGAPNPRLARIHQQHAPDRLGWQKSTASFPPAVPAVAGTGHPWIGAEWAVGPLAGGSERVGDSPGSSGRIEPSRFVRRLALALFALAPFVVFMSGSHMNHVTLADVADAGYDRALQRRPGRGAARRRRRMACGFALGMAATIRPVDAIAFALPAGALVPTRTCSATCALAGVRSQPASGSPFRWRCSAPSTGPPLVRHCGSATPSCGAARTTSGFTPHHGATSTHRRADSSC